VLRTRTVPEPGTPFFRLSTLKLSCSTYPHYSEELIANAAAVNSAPRSSHAATLFQGSPRYRKTKVVKLLTGTVNKNGLLSWFAASVW
jgi:hypothetical protein